MSTQLTETHRRPRIRASVERIPLPGGDLLLTRSRGEDIRVRDISQADLELLDALDGTHALLELEQRFGTGAVRATLTELSSLGLVEDAREEEPLDEEVLRRFDRQLRYFGEVAGPSGPTPAKCQRLLAGATVAVLGSGGLGGRVALDLASIGVGRLRLADGDLVETSNLARQIQYSEADLGLPKVECLAARISGLNAATQISMAAEMLTDEAAITAFVAGADLVVDAADWPPHEIERLTNAACFGLGIPYIGMSHFPPFARFGPLYVPGLTGCYACQEAAFRRTHALYDVVADHRSRNSLPSATLGPACGLTAGWVATEAMHFLTGVAKPRTIGAAYTVDLLAVEVSRHEVVAEPDCPVCGEARTDGAMSKNKREMEAA